MATVTWDAINKGTGVVLSNGNLTAVIPNNSNMVRAAEGKTSGKWYWEIAVSVVFSATIGVANSSAPLNSLSHTTQNARYYFSTSGNKYPGNLVYGKFFEANDVIGIALDLDIGTLEFYKNGVSQGIAFTNVKEMGEVFPAIASVATSVGSTTTANFGATPFKYDIPMGYYSYDGNQKNILTANKSFILRENKYTKYVNKVWNDVSSTTPTLIQFQNEGMDDISILNRSIQLAGVQSMNNSEVLGSGKVFKSTVDLSKYFDLRKLEVK